MKNEDYIAMDFSDIPTDGDFDRREFLKRLGGGVLILFTIGEPAALLAQRGRSYPSDFNAYLRIAEDGMVTCFSGKIEMGQGAITSLAQMLADELDVALDSVKMVMGDTSVCPWDMGTFGSMTTRFFGPAVRAAGAEARGVMLELAAEQLAVEKDQLVVSDGTVSIKGQSSKRVTYGELAKGKAIERHLKQKPPLKSPADFKIMGKPHNRIDAIEKVTGKALYAGDIRLDGMLYAQVLRPPAHGAKLKSVDTSAAEKMDGVRVVHDGDFVAVLHQTPDGAERALEQVKAEFDVPPPTVDDKTIFDHLLKNAPSRGRTSGDGNVEVGKRTATRTSDLTYYNSYVAHAAMETHTALVNIDGDQATVWASTQGPFRVTDEVARAIGFRSENVRVITPYVGGGFGGKTSAPQAAEAARLAKEVKRPVQVCWSRADEFYHDTFRPAAVVKIDAGTTARNKIAYWNNNVYFAGQRGSDFFYSSPNHRTAIYGEWMGGGGPHPFGVGAWRAPANNTNTFARESHIDAMAAAAGMDPIAFRLNNLTDERMIRVLKAAAKQAGWRSGKAPSGRGLGVACGIDAGTYVTTIAEVEVDKETGEVQVKRIVCAQDMGLVINPEGARIQMEGCITMGLGYTLSEEVRFRGGKILDENFNTYELPRFSWLPKIETIFVETGDLSPQGGGEPAIVTMGGVVANAVFDATGARVLQLPMTPERVKAAMAKA